MINKLIRLFTISLLAFSMVSCGPTNEEKAQDDANVLLKRQKSLVSDLNTSGHPTSSWSEEDVDTYESKLNELESVEKKLKAANGKNKVRIGRLGVNEDFIYTGRVMIILARYDIKNSKRPSLEKLTDTQKYERLDQDIYNLESAAILMSVNEDLSLNELILYFVTLEKIIKKQQEILFLFSKNSVLVSNQEEIKSAIENAKQINLNDRGGVLNRIAKKKLAAS
ncbi:MAG: hypothetical protein HOO06_06130 [Bdellovibrionaceae bacterium]|jgi:hypothetical protein|nr:hypothetical protein [Pseudobdellovibrionaceae bacterium]